VFSFNRWIRSLLPMLNFLPLYLTGLNNLTALDKIREFSQTTKIFF
jgi:hypothetical protein